jgi:hypothetical protein
MEVVVAIEPDFPQMCPCVMQSQFEPPVARLFLVIDVSIIQQMSVSDLSPLFAEASFEQMVPSNFVLRVDKGSEQGFAVVRVHLKAVVGKSAANTL